MIITLFRRTSGCNPNHKQSVKAIKTLLSLLHLDFSVVDSTISLLMFVLLLYVLTHPLSIGFLPHMPIVLLYPDPHPVLWLLLFRCVQLCSGCDCVAKPRLKVAHPYRCRHQSDKGHKPKPTCLQACSACVSVYVWGVSIVLWPEPIRQERRRIVRAAG